MLKLYDSLSVYINNKDIDYIIFYHHLHEIRGYMIIYDQNISSLVSINSMYGNSDVPNTISRLDP